MADETAKDALMKELIDALQEMVTAHSMRNIGLEASKRRIAAVTNARKVLAKAKS